MTHVVLTDAQAKRLIAMEARNRRRARDKGIRHERVDFVSVLEAQGWLCTVCEAPLDPSIPYPDPMSISLGHTPGLECGGFHIRRHVSGQHWGCNSAEANRVDKPVSAQIKRQAKKCSAPLGLKTGKAQARKKAQPKGRGFQTNRNGTFKRTMSGKTVRRD